MCYALMYRRRFPSAESFRAGIYPLRYLQSDVMLARWEKQEELTEALVDQFEERLRAILAELLDPSLPFAPTAIANSCRFCPAKAFCPATRSH